jgi:TetR/AcrR family transcriptional repressor of nem operon
MARPRQSEGTRKRLLEASMSAFLERGYHGTGLKELLDSVAVPKGSFYNYFPSKEELGAAAIRYYGECTVASLAGAMDGAPDALTGLRTFFDRWMVDFERARYRGGCLVVNLAGELDDSEVCRRALKAAFRGWRDGVADALRRAQNEGAVRGDIDAGQLADLLTESWEGAVIRMKIECSVAPLQRCLRRLLDDYFQPRR